MQKNKTKQKNKTNRCRKTEGNCNLSNSKFTFHASHHYLDILFKNRKQVKSVRILHTLQCPIKKERKTAICAWLLPFWSQSNVFFSDLMSGFTLCIKKTKLSDSGNTQSQCPCELKNKQKKLNYRFNFRMDSVINSTADNNTVGIVLWGNALHVKPWHLKVKSSGAQNVSRAFFSYNK